MRRQIWDVNDKGNLVLRA